MTELVHSYESSNRMTQNEDMSSRETFNHFRKPAPEDGPIVSPDLKDVWLNGKQQLQSYGQDNGVQLSRESMMLAEPVTVTRNTHSIANGEICKRTERLSLGFSLKSGSKKSFVWRYFFHPELRKGVCDLSHTQCRFCNSRLAFNTSGTTTTMLNHLKSRHAGILERDRRKPPGSESGPNEDLRFITGCMAVQTGDSFVLHTDLCRKENLALRFRGEVGTTYQRRGYRGRPPGSNRRLGPHCSHPMDWTGLRSVTMGPNLNRKLPFTVSTIIYFDITT